MNIVWAEKLQDPKSSGKLAVAGFSIVIMIVGAMFGSGSRGSGYPIMAAAIGKDLKAIERDNDGDVRAIGRKKSILVKQYIARNAHFIGEQTDRDLLNTYNSVADAVCGKEAENPIITLVEAIERGASDRVQRGAFTQAEYSRIAKAHDGEAFASYLTGGLRLLGGDICGAFIADMGIVNHMTKDEKLRYLARQKFSPNDVQFLMNSAIFAENIMPL